MATCPLRQRETLCGGKSLGEAILQIFSNKAAFQPKITTGKPVQALIDMVLADVVNSIHINYHSDEWADTQLFHKLQALILTKRRG